MGTILPHQYEMVKTLYEKDGLSSCEISKKLQISIGAVYYFLRHHKIPRRKANESNRLRYERSERSFHPVHPLKPSQVILKTVALSLYWAEGAKGGYTVDFTNSNEKMCLIFLKFLREICRVDERKLRGYIYCHEKRETKKLISYWSRLTGIPKSQFSKPYIKQTDKTERLSHPKRMPYGLLHVRYSDLKLLIQILQWIEEESSLWVGSEAVKRTTL